MDSQHNIFTGCSGRCGSSPALSRRSHQIFARTQSVRHPHSQPPGGRLHARGHGDRGGNVTPGLDEVGLASGQRPEEQLRGLDSQVLGGWRCQQVRYRRGTNFRRKRLQHWISRGETYEGRENLPDLWRNGTDSKDNHFEKCSWTGEADEQVIEWEGAFFYHYFFKVWKQKILSFFPGDFQFWKLCHCGFIVHHI